MYAVVDKERQLESLTTYFRSREEADTHVAGCEMFKIGHEGPIPGIEYLEIQEVERDSHPCSLCGGEVTAKDPVKYPYCRSCHYNGLAAEHLRSEQMEFFASQLGPSGGAAYIEHTGGGCMWLAFRWEDEVEFYTSTMTDAFLPEDEEGNPIRDEWGLVAMQYDLEEKWDEFDMLHDSGYEPDLKCPRLTDAELVKLILEHRSVRLGAV